MARDPDPYAKAALAIHELLQPGETLLWQGRPERSRPLSGAERSVATVAPFLGGTLLLLALLLRNDEGGLREALFVPAIGSLVIGSLLILKASGTTFGALRHHGYAVTDRRALMARSGRGGPTVEEYTPSLIAYVHIYPIAEGVADVIFREGPNVGGWPDSRRAHGRELNPIGFRAIRNAEAAAEALRALREGAMACDANDCMGR